MSAISKFSGELWFWPCSDKLMYFLRTVYSKVLFKFLGNCSRTWFNFKWRKHIFFNYFSVKAVLRCSTKIYPKVWNFVLSINMKGNHQLFISQKKMFFTDLQWERIWRFESTCDIFKQGEDIFLHFIKYYNNTLKMRWLKVK